MSDERNDSKRNETKQSCEWRIAPTQMSVQTNSNKLRTLIEAHKHTIQAIN